MRNLFRAFELPIEADARATAQELGDAGYKTSVFPLDPGATVPSEFDFMSTPSRVLVAETRAEDDDTYMEALAEGHDERLENFGPQ